MKPIRRILSSSLLKSDPDYQRQVDMKRVGRIVKDFNERLLNPIKVSFRGGCYWIVDGQHSFIALTIINEGKDFPVECLVFQGLTKKEEAVLFARQNGYAKSVSKRDQFKAMYTASDETIMKIMSLVGQAGLEVSFKSKGTSYNKIEAVVKLEKIYRNMSDGDFLNILKIIKAAWSGDKHSLVGEILGGMYVFHKNYKGQFEEKKLIERLKAVEPIEIVRKGKANHRIKGDNKYALEIVRIYNKRMRGNRKLDDSLVDR